MAKRVWQEGERGRQWPDEGRRRVMTLMTQTPAAMDKEPAGPVMMGDPGEQGRFGPFGGRFVPEALVPACEELERAFRAAWADPGFRAELAGTLRDYAGRPPPGTEAARLRRRPAAASAARSTWVSGTWNGRN